VPPNNQQLTPLLSNAALSRLERLRINTNRRFTDKRRGEHLRGRGGTSTEFSDFRDYVAGDDMRFVDWNAFARLNRPYVKLYEQEEEMYVLLLVDASSSMVFEDKLLRAKELAAAYGVMGLLGNERVCACVFNSTGASPTLLRPCRGRASMMKLFAFLEGIEGGGDSSVDEGIETMLKHLTGRGVAVVLSDFLTFGDTKRALNRLFSSGLEPFAVQILAPAEMDPDVSGDSRLIDCETEHTLDVSCNADLLRLYQEHRQSFERELEIYCRQRSGQFVCVNSAESTDWILFDLMRRRGWVK